MLKNKRSIHKMEMAKAKEVSLFRSQKAVEMGVTFANFKIIADDSVIPTTESVLAGYKQAR